MLSRSISNPVISIQMGKFDDLARRRILTWMMSTGITQERLGEKIGRNPSWMSRYLDGGWDADLDTLEQFAKAFDRTLFELLDIPTGSEKEVELIERFRATRASAREAALIVFREMTAPVVSRGRTRKRGGG